MMYFASMAIAIVSTVAYNICQKSINQSINPGVTMIATYVVAIVASCIIIFVVPGGISFAESYRHLNWASFLLGLCAVGLEVGFLYVYRSGWSIAVAPLFASVGSTVLLLIVGFFIYKEKLTLVNGIGICLSVIGLILMNRK